MFAQAAVSSRILRWLVSAGLFALFLALEAAPLALALAPRDCGCSCPRSSHTCCCRRSTHEAETDGLRWTSVPCCNGHCPRAAAVPVSFSALPVTLGSARVAPKADACPQLTFASDSDGHSSYLDLAFLYQRPPPLA